MVIYVDIHHAHDKEDFLDEVSRALRFPETLAADWSAFAGGLKDLSWLSAKGWVVILEKSKHFCGGHGTRRPKRSTPWKRPPSTGAAVASRSGRWSAAGRLEIRLADMPAA